MRILPSTSTACAWRLRFSIAAAAAALLAACGGEQDQHQSERASYNAIITASSGATALSGEFDSVKGYLSQGGSVMRGRGKGLQQARFGLDVPRRGFYEVFAWWPQAADGAGIVEATLQDVSVSHSSRLDQRQLGGQWNSLGVFELGPQGGQLVLRSGDGTRLYADAVRVQWVGAEQPPLRLATTELSVADRDDPYEAVLQAWSGRAPYRYALTGGRLPDGLVLDGQSGRLAGVPAEVGSFVLQMQVSDADGRSAQGELTLEVVQSIDTPGSVPAQPFRLRGDRKRALGDGAGVGAPMAELGALPGILRAMPEGSWAKVNLNQFSDAWVPADLRPLFGQSNPTPAKIITAWSSFVWDSNRGNLLLYGGGHANYRGNEVYMWRGATQRWERASLPSEMRQDALGNWNAVDSADAAPASAHTYDNTIFLPQLDRMLVLGGAADSNGGMYLRLGSDGKSRATGFYLFNPARAHPDRVGGSTGSHVQRVAPWPEILGGNMWTNRETYMTAPTASVFKGGYVNGCTGYEQVGGKDVVYIRNASDVFRLTLHDIGNPAADTWERVGVKWFGSGTKAVCTFDPVQRVLLRTATQTVPFVYWSMSNAGAGNRDVTVVPADPSGTFMQALASNSINIANCGLEHDPRRNDYKLWCGGGTVWRLTPPPVLSPSGWAIVPLTPDAGAVPDATVANGVLGKWKYISNIDAFMALQDSVQGNIWLYKPVGWVDPGTGNPGGGGGNVPPSVTLTHPSEGSSYSVGSAIAIGAVATDSDGTVARVEFFAGGSKIGESLSLPYQFTWTGAPIGQHLISARVTDNQGASAVSAAVNINVADVPNAAPSVALVAPAAGATFTVGATIGLLAQASDSDGTVGRVEFYAGIVKIGESTAHPFAFNWSAAAAGPLVLSAIAYDDDGTPSPASSVTVSVVPANPGGSNTVTIQRGTFGNTAIADTYLSSYSKTRNFGTADALLELGQYSVLLRASIFQSEGGPIPNGATIESAQLAVFKWTSYAMTYGVHRMLQPWSETSSTWNERLPGTPWAAPGGKVAGADHAALPEASGSIGYDPGWVSFDITSHVQTLSNTVMAQNHGWRLNPTAGATSSLKRFYSSEYIADPLLRPKLVITYR